MHKLAIASLLLVSYLSSACSSPQKAAVKFGQMQGLQQIAVGDLCNDNEEPIILRAQKQHSFGGNVPFFGNGFSTGVSNILCCSGKECRIVQ